MEVGTAAVKGGEAAGGDLDEGASEGPDRPLVAVEGVAVEVDLEGEGRALSSLSCQGLSTP